MKELGNWNYALFTSEVVYSCPNIILVNVLNTRLHASQWFIVLTANNACCGQHRHEDNGIIVVLSQSTGAVWCPRWEWCLDHRWCYVSSHDSLMTGQLWLGSSFISSLCSWSLLQMPHAPSTTKIEKPYALHEVNCVSQATMPINTCYSPCALMFDIL